MADSGRTQESVRVEPIIDITQPLGPGTPVYPGDPPVAIEPILSIAQDGMALSCLSLGSHAGTHIDPPAHFIPGGLTVDRLPLDTLVGPALLIDVAQGRPVAAADLAALPAAQRVLLRTGGQPLSEEAARLLVTRGVRLVGVDALSVDSPARDFPVHHLLLGAGIVIVEGLALQGVAPGAYMLICLPLPITGGDGAPARAVLLPTVPPTR